MTDYTRGVIDGLRKARSICDGMSLYYKRQIMLDGVENAPESLSHWANAYFCASLRIAEAIRKEEEVAD